MNVQVESEFTLRANVDFGVIPTHIKFVGGLVPDEQGRLPRGDDGRLLSVAELAHLQELSPVKMTCTQVPHFPGVHSGDTDDLINGIKALGLKPYLILMVAGGDPTDPAAEETVLPMLVDGLKLAQQYEIENVSSTSIEEWMRPGGEPLVGEAFDAAVAQNVRLHARAIRESGALGSCVKAWHIEFLRGIEFQTFTDIRKAWTLVKAANEEIGQPFFNVLVDAAHCGDSGLSKDENISVIQEIARADAFSMFHASAKTTRGCLTTSGGWVEDLLEACAATGELKIVLVELFHHKDAALEGLRAAVPGHGVDTTSGRTYSDTVRDGMISVATQLNSLADRGFF